MSYVFFLDKYLPGCAVAPIFDFINSDSKEKTNALWGSNGTHMLYGNLTNIF